MNVGDFSDMRISIYLRMIPMQYALVRRLRHDFV